MEIFISVQTTVTLERIQQLNIIDMADKKKIPDFSNFHGKKGRSGRLSRKKEMEFWDHLDRNIPEVINYVLRVIRKAEREANALEDDFADPKLRKMFSEDIREWHKIGLKAADILLGKAPQRVAQTDPTGKIIFSLGM